LFSELRGKRELKETTIHYKYLTKEKVLHVELIGAYRQAPSLEFVRKIMEEMGEDRCRKCLVDFRKGELIVNKTITYYRPDQFKELDISYTNRVAFVVNTITADLQFYENVFVNRGYNFFMFDNFRKAMTWLKK